MATINKQTTPQANSNVTSQLPWDHQWNQWNAANSPHIAQMTAITSAIRGQAVYQPDIIGTGNV